MTHLTRTEQIRQELGLKPGGHLPARGVRQRVISGGRLVRVLSEMEVKARRPRIRKPHRVEERCIVCGDWIPAGRLLQHEKGHR